MSKRTLVTKLVIAFCLGFSSGLPFSAVESTLQAWLSDSKVDITQIGLFGWVMTPYLLKPLWAPFLDRYIPPFLGRRRGWAVISQIGIILSLGAMGTVSPANNPGIIAMLAVLASFFSASQDIALDAHRREIFSDHELGLASSIFVNGYRVGMMTSGALALWLSQHMSWGEVYWFMGALMLVGTLTCLFAPEPKISAENIRSLQSAIVEPFKEFFTRKNWLLILSFILLYKLGDSMAAALRTKFLLDVGYSKNVIVEIAKTFGLFAGIAGGLLGGVLLLKIGLKRSLWIFGILQAIATIGFWWLARIEPSPAALAWVIGTDNVCVGMATAAYVAFVSSICDTRFTATQYAALTSLMRLPSLAITSLSGFFVQSLGWDGFFFMCVILAFPGLLLVQLVNREEGLIKS